MDFSGKVIALGITGGIAAYRACDLIRELFRRGASRVPCVMTFSAQAFITPLTLEALSREPVYHSDMGMSFGEPGEATPTHIALAQQADAFLILPATADAIAKLAHGLADDPVTTTAITFSQKPVLLAPAMNTRMWQHLLTQANLERLKSVAGYTIIAPSHGHLACGETGEGHLADQETVLRALYHKVHPQAGLYQGMRVLVSAGGTVEPIDPVRVITNRSSGAMGLAVADEAAAMGAEVTLVTTRPPVGREYTVIPVTTALEMKTTLDRQFSKSDVLVMTAAVSDFRLATPSEEKMKRASRDSLTLHLKSNPDILASLSLVKRPNQQVVGFAAESTGLADNAIDKLRRKGLDAIVANDISRRDIGFDVSDNEVTIFFPSGEALTLEKTSKSSIARQLLRLLRERSACEE